MVHARSVHALILYRKNAIVYILVVYVVIQAQPIDNYCMIQLYVVGLPLYKPTDIFMILTINGIQAALKKGSSIEYVSENLIIIDTENNGNDWLEINSHKLPTCSKITLLRQPITKEVIINYWFPF